jgi:hypothetical protein
MGRYRHKHRSELGVCGAGVHRARSKKHGTCMVTLVQVHADAFTRSTCSYDNCTLGNKEKSIGRKLQALTVTPTPHFNLVMIMPGKKYAHVCEKLASCGNGSTMYVRGDGLTCTKDELSACKDTLYLNHTYLNLIPQARCSICS